MNKVRFLVSVSTVSESFAPGDETTVSDVQAKQWVASGLVVLVEDAPANSDSFANAASSQDAAPVVTPSLVKSRKSKRN